MSLLRRDSASTSSGRIVPGVSSIVAEGDTGREERRAVGRVMDCVRAKRLNAMRSRILGVL